jgi:hypothetical protein
MATQSKEGSVLERGIMGSNPGFRLSSVLFCAVKVQICHSANPIPELSQPLQLKRNSYLKGRPAESFVVATTVPTPASYGYRDLLRR